MLLPGGSRPRTRSTRLPSQSSLPASHLVCHISLAFNTELCTNPPHTVKSQARFPTPTPARFPALSPATFPMLLLASGAGNCLPSISASPFLCQLSIKPVHWCNLPTYPAPKSNPQCTELPGSEARSRLLAVRQGQLWTSCTQVMGARSHCVQC